MTALVEGEAMVALRSIRQTRSQVCALRPPPCRKRIGRTALTPIEVMQAHPMDDEVMGFRKGRLSGSLSPAYSAESLRWSICSDSLSTIHAPGLFRFEITAAQLYEL